MEPIHIGSARQLFVDRYLIDALRDTRLVLHQPERREPIIEIDRPWEIGGVAYAVLFEDQGVYRAWYRCTPEADTDSTAKSLTAYAESDDGIHWRKPSLGLVEFQGSTDNNLVVNDPDLVNFAPFKDEMAPAAERYKAIGRRGAVFSTVSPDGLHWTKRPDPVQTVGPFDSHNIALRDPWTGKYLMYTRGIRKEGIPGHGVTANFKEGVRWIRRAESDDFSAWSPLELIETDDETLEHLYTNSFMPYERAPGLYLIFPSRFVNDRSPTPDWSHVGISDAILMSSRDSKHFDRTFKEAWVRPGPDPNNWHERSVYIMRGIIDTGPAEISLYMSDHWRLPSNTIRRLALRKDGFTSLQADYRGGEVLTHPLVFAGDELRLNMSTSAAGSIRVEIQDQAGQPLPGLSLADCPEIYHDQIDRVVRWNTNADLGALAGQPVRLRFALCDADLYAFHFTGER